MTTIQSAWLIWSALSILVAIAASLAANLALPNYDIEAAALVFGAGLAWSGLTPRILRAAGRRL